MNFTESAKDKKRNKHPHLLDGVVTIVQPSEDLGIMVGPRGLGARELIKNPPDLARPRTAFDSHTTTTVSLTRSDSEPYDPESKKAKRAEQHFYRPQHGLAAEIGKVIASKGKVSWTQCND